MKTAERRHRLAAALAYEGAADESELCAYQRRFVEGEAQPQPNLAPTLEILARFALALAEAER